jgi:hypothetical protein
MEKEDEPELIKRRKIKSFRTGIASLGVFGDNNHTAWHTFEKTMTTKEFSDTMSGKLFSKTQIDLSTKCSTPNYTTRNVFTSASTKRPRRRNMSMLSTSN